MNVCSYIYYLTILHTNLWTASNNKPATSSKHFTEAKTPPFPAGLSKSGELFFDGEPQGCPE
jgi:hypothetical protein